MLRENKMARWPDAIHDGALYTRNIRSPYAVFIDGEMTGTDVMECMRANPWELIR